MLPAQAFANLRLQPGYWSIYARGRARDFGAVPFQILFVVVRAHKQWCCDLPLRRRETVRAQLGKIVAAMTR